MERKLRIGILKQGGKRALKEYSDILDMVDRIGRRKKKTDDYDYYPKNLQDCYEELAAGFYNNVIMDEDSEYVVVKE